MVARMSDDVAQANHVQLKVRVRILEKLLRMHQITLAAALWIASWVVSVAREDLRGDIVSHNLTYVLGEAWSTDGRWPGPDQPFWALRIGTGLLVVGLLGLAILYIARWMTWSENANWPLWVVLLVVLAGTVLTLFGITTLPYDSWSPTPWVVLPVVLCILVLYSEKTQDTW